MNRLYMWAGQLALFWSLFLFAFGAAAERLADDEKRRLLAIEFQRLLAADNPATASIAEQEIWRLWFTGPTDEITDGLAMATAKLRSGAFTAAEEQLSALILKAPNYAELWNQRAFARFLNGELEKSLQDIRRVLLLEPRHFGALAGRARIEARLGGLEQAQRTMGEVGAVHPWLARNSPIPADPPPPAPIRQQEL